VKHRKVLHSRMRRLLRDSLVTFNVNKNDVTGGQASSTEMPLGKRVNKAEELNYLCKHTPECSGLIRKYKTTSKRLARDKHASLFSG
jgi:hypothetical protein